MRLTLKLYTPTKLTSLWPDGKCTEDCAPVPSSTCVTSVLRTMQHPKSPRLLQQPHSGMPARCDNRSPAADLQRFEAMLTSHSMAGKTCPRETWAAWRIPGFEISMLRAVCTESATEMDVAGVYAAVLLRVPGLREYRACFSVFSGML